MNTPLDCARLADGLHRLRSDRGAVVVKRRRDVEADFFAAEARGLEALRATRTLRVPAVHAIDAGWLVLEDLGRGAPGVDDWIRAGRRLAALHATHADRFGYAFDGWCGDAAQANTPTVDGHAFFAERRLLAQASRAAAAGLLDSGDLHRIEGIALRLREWIPIQPAVLVHGDLWLGNLHACSHGEIALIDAGAVHHGWAEADLAMTRLFGTPPAAFHASYAEAAGIDTGWIDRAPLYNLYHLLNHLNLFGAGYREDVRAVLRRYA